jgi:hypothetical protein
MFTKDFTLSSSTEGLPKPPKPRLFKANSAQNIRPYDETFVSLEKKNIIFQGVRRAHIYALLTLFVKTNI